jgi:hypothetical protein
MPKQKAKDPRVQNAGKGWEGLRSEEKASSAAQLAYGAPPPPSEFINGEIMEKHFKGRALFRITGIRAAVGGNSKFGDRPGFFFDLDHRGTPYVARITNGSNRHRILWDRFGDAAVGESITLRLPRPSDKTREAWVIE